MMIELINNHHSELTDLCRRHKVNRLEVFGSASDGTFNPEKSDLDFLVEFLPLQPGEHARAYFGLLHGLEDLFERKIDLVMPRAIRNRYFREAVEQSRHVVYAA